jgi:hypothetical protein
MGVYDHLVKQYGPENVYIATSAKQDGPSSPFTLVDKIGMMTKMGVPRSRIIQVTNPYKINEMEKLLGLNPKEDQLVYALGAKDADRFKYTPDSPMQLLSQTKKMQPVGKHAYIEVVPTIQFNVLGQKVADASKIREMYRKGNDNDRMQIITDLYGIADPELKAIFDERLGVNETGEGIIHGQERIYAGENPVSVMRERREHLMKKITEMREQLAQFRRLNLNEQAVVDYIDEKKSRKI